MKFLYRANVEVWWWLEMTSGNLWRSLAGDRVSYWFDPVPAFFCQRRYDAQNAFFRRFQETLYGKPLRCP